MNKNNKVGNYFEVDGISHCLNPAIVSEALRLSLVDTGESLNYEADIHVANQIYSAYLDSQGRLHRVSTPE